MLDFIVDESLCIRCKECVRDCPARIIVQTGNELPSITAAAEENCLRCQHCLAVCPTGAISILGKLPADSQDLATSEQPTLNAIEQLVRSRRSIRRYKPANLEPELIQSLLTTAEHAPTGANRRDLTFTVIDDQDVMKAIRQRVMEALRTAVEAGAVPEHLAYVHASVPAYFKYRADLIFRGAPHLLLVSAGPEALCANEDVIIALTTFELAAAAAGVGTTWCGMLKMALEASPDLKPLLGLAPDQTYYYAMLFGTPNVRYSRTVQREGNTTIQRLAKPEQ
jgi:nitroreductase/NAD-dependent dihydropyrimidine dehydrogenase PreA subunit